MNPERLFAIAKRERTAFPQQSNRGTGIRRPDQDMTLGQQLMKRLTLQHDTETARIFGNVCLISYLTSTEAEA